MLLQDASTIARNVRHHLLFAAEHSHSDLGGCANGVADTLPARQTARLCSWHACVSVWIATSFRPRPRMHKHANVWWSMQLHEGGEHCTTGRRASPARDLLAAQDRARYASRMDAKLIKMQAKMNGEEESEQEARARMRDQWRRQLQSRVRDAHAICARRSDHDLGQLRSHHVSAHDAVPTTLPPAAW